MKVLITNSAGYIGSHTCIELINAGYEIVVLDNLCNSSEHSIDSIRKLTGATFPFYKVDLLNLDAVIKIFQDESLSQPMLYYHNNITGTLNLVKAMLQFNINNLVFSSSATVYGATEHVPISEEENQGDRIVTSNPYGTTKLFIEKILTDIQISNPQLSITFLRYFNPIGAHKSGELGEDPKGVPNNLLPYIARVAIGKLPKLHVFGNDYPTPDGTGVRDYIHVVDLAIGHIKALEHNSKKPGISVYNLGTGKGYSVLEVLRAFEKACKKVIPYEIESRRPGDIAISWANIDKAKRELDWVAVRNLDEMCEDAWRWQKKHPAGFLDK